MQENTTDNPTKPEDIELPTSEIGYDRDDNSGDNSADTKPEDWKSTTEEQ